MTIIEGINNAGLLVQGSLSGPEPRGLEAAYFPSSGDFSFVSDVPVLDAEQDDESGRVSQATRSLTAFLDDHVLGACCSGLILNAIDAVLMSQSLDVKRGGVRIAVTRIEGALSFAVLDVGDGFPRQVVSILKAREPLERLDSAKERLLDQGKPLYGGNGYDLLATRKILEERGGALFIHRTEGGHTIVGIDCPVVV